MTWDNETSLTYGALIGFILIITIMVGMWLEVRKRDRLDEGEEQ